jgi:site-specific DNA-methyltransferase (adenine-specific)
MPEKLSRSPKKEWQLALWPEECLSQRDESLLQGQHAGKHPYSGVRASVDLGDSMQTCDGWPAPTVIVSDGPYGLASYPGDPATPDGLADCYEPFVKKWYERALPSATLWFWNSEQGWANCHRMIEACGWEFRNCHIWDKGIAHVAGNCNTRTIRKYPVVTEVCAQYVRKNRLVSSGVPLPIKEWVRAEWKRTGLPFRLTNEACGVKDAATRKYFATDAMWYFPPPDAFVAIAAYANAHGRVEGRPYFTKDDGSAFSADEWELMRAKFHCEVGVSNVWHHPAVRGSERIKKGSSCLHMNQKPIELLMQIIRSSSDVGDVVWEPFGGLCSASVAAVRLGRSAYAAELNPDYHATAERRLHEELSLHCI